MYSVLVLLLSGLLLSGFQLAAALTVRTPATEAYFAKYKKSLPADYNVISNGGWYALEKKAVAKMGAEKFASLKPNLPANFSVVKAGGWSTLQSLAADPKGMLLKLIHANLKGSQAMDQYLDAIVALLHAEGKGFDAEIVDGEWVMVYQRQASKSPPVQQLVSNIERGAKTTDSNFDVKKREFYGAVDFLGGKGQLFSTVKYKPVPDNYSVVNKKIVIRRIGCDITDAKLKLKFLPKLPLPLRRKGGYLDFEYLDEDIRVTRGNRGGLFIHARPAFCAKEFAAAT